MSVHFVVYGCLHCTASYLKGTVWVYDCRMVITIKLFQRCFVRTTLIRLLIIVSMVLPDLSCGTRCNDKTTTDVFMICAPSATRISCWKSNSWLTLFHRTRFNELFAMYSFDFCWVSLFFMHNHSLSRCGPSFDVAYIYISSMGHVTSTPRVHRPMLRAPSILHTSLQMTGELRQQICN